MTRWQNGSVAALGVLLLVGPGCARDSSTVSTTHEPARSAPSTPSEPVPQDTASGEPSAPTAQLPIPPGAQDWPVREVSTCQDLPPVTEPELVVRVSVVTPDCIEYSEHSDVLVFVTTRVAAGLGSPRPVAAPDFDGDLASIRSPSNRGVAYVADPAGESARYVVLWDGGPATLDRIIGELLSSPSLS